MPQPTTRRFFCRSIVLMTATSLATIKNILPETSPQAIKSKKSILTKLQPIEGGFVAIDGWVMPMKGLIQGDG